ncbi:MAG: transglutaminase domain-containing protein, partial [Deltaproteobacteria bacterium]|nr:transglutaminase domain-containing protein [Deltaproteobacteria bacterium]
MLPGHTKVEALLVSPQEARDFFQTTAPKGVEGIAVEGAEILSSTAVSPEIEALARGLKNDPDLIYAYVHDHIEHTPIFGSLKGAAATLLDGEGNDFDQASLMIALLRQAGFTANFIYGV